MNENQRTMSQKHADYMEKRISYDEYYLWLCDFVGLDESHIPVSDKALAASIDKHLNDIDLRIWDRMDYAVRYLAYSKGLVWALSDTVCCLKAMARRKRERLRKEVTQ